MGDSTTQPSINQTTNFTRLMKANVVDCTTMTDEIIVMSSGRISNLFDPVNPTDVATKYFVDHSSSIGASGPVNSIQFSTGTTFTGVAALMYTSDTFYVTNKFTMAKGTTGTISITSNQISGLSNPVDDNQVANIGYLPELSVVNLSTSVASTNLTASQVVNKYLNRTITATSGTIQDILPTNIAVTTLLGSSGVTSGTFSFSFVYNYTGTASTVLLFGNIIPEGNYQYINNPIPVITVSANNIVSFKATIGTDGSVAYYIKNTQPIYDVSTSGPLVTSVGLKTDNFTSTKTITNNSFIIYPLVPTAVTLDGAYTYTYADIRNRLIIRSGITTDTTDTFDILANWTTDEAFSLGSGQIKFVIQNISSHNLKVGPDSAPTGWYYDTNYNRTIPPNKNGLFYINYTGTTFILYTIGIYDRYG
jgi:hypothetical protein